MTTNDILGEDVAIDEGRSEVPQERPRYQRRQFNKNPQIGLEIVILTEKIILPVDEFPKYNLVGKLLGLKGSNLKKIQTDCQVRVSIMGRGSSKERNKEDELIQSGDPQYDHLKEPLHVIISARANMIEAHRRLASACRELVRFLWSLSEEMAQLQPPEYNREHVSIGREAAPAPKIMFGVPPPGAIILNNNPSFAAQARFTRSDERTLPPRESYTYGGYAESSSRGGTSRHAEKRSSSETGTYPLKRYKQDPFVKTEGTSSYI